MKKIILLFSVIASCWGCEKNVIGTYRGEKTIYYPAVNFTFTDTITIEFDGSEYTYSGKTYTHPPDNGSGTFNIKHDSIVFNDAVARNTLYTWDWILVGKYRITLSNDSMILIKENYGIRHTCRLIKNK